MVNYQSLSTRHFFFLPCDDEFWCQRQDAAGFGGVGADSVLILLPVKLSGSQKC